MPVTELTREGFHIRLEFERLPIQPCEPTVNGTIKVTYGSTITVTDLDATPPEPVGYPSSPLKVGLGDDGKPDADELKRELDRLSESVLHQAKCTRDISHRGKEIDEQVQSILDHQAG